jgi:hypothetical protein
MPKNPNPKFAEFICSSPENVPAHKQKGRFAAPLPAALEA